MNNLITKESRWICYKFVGDSMTSVEGFCKANNSQGHMLDLLYMLPIQTLIKLMMCEGNLSGIIEDKDGNILIWITFYSTVIVGSIV